MLRSITDILRGHYTIAAWSKRSYSGIGYLRLACFFLQHVTRETMSDGTVATRKAWSDFFVALGCALNLALPREQANLRGELLEECVGLATRLVLPLSFTVPLNMRLKKCRTIHEAIHRFRNLSKKVSAAVEAQ